MDSNNTLVCDSTKEKTKIGIYRTMSSEIEVVPPPRENMIIKAITFLTNPKVVTHPLAEKERFLVNHGLTNEEIKAAFDRATQQKDASPQFIPPPPPVALVPITPFQKFRDILQTVALLTGVTYGIFQFIKSVIIPYFFDKPKKPSEFEAAATELKRVMQESVGQLRADVQKIQTDLERVVIVQSEQQNTVRSMGDIKSEVATVKGILLSRNQFPSVPLTGSASIPAWQMAACQDAGDRSSEVPNSNGGSQNSDSSLEMIKEAEVSEVES